MTIVSAELLEVIDQREPTEDESLSLPARIADDGGQWDSIGITQEQVEVLMAKGLIYYCANCTRTTIEVGEGEDDSENTYAAREYHTVEALCDVDNPKAYLAQIIDASHT